ncbi:YbaN family protein [Aliidiomarina sp. Khilg15.8]
MRNMLRQLFWRTLAVLALALAAVGIPLPGLPTVPFVLVAAWAGARGWPSLEAKLLTHPRYGPAVSAWRQNRAIPRKAKFIASAMMLISSLLLTASNAPVMLKIALIVFLCGVAIWLWRRPEPVE